MFVEFSPLVELSAELFVKINDICEQYIEKKTGYISISIEYTDEAFPIDPVILWKKGE